MGRRGGKRQHYERLEFLGDRVLGLVVADLLWRRFPNEADGELTRRHAHLVRGEALAEVARAVGLGRHIIALKERGHRGRARRSAHARRYVRGSDRRALSRWRARRFGDPLRRACWWEPRPRRARARRRASKTALQEWAQARGLPLPAYKSVPGDGPAHRRLFTVTVRVEGLPPASATGSSKRAAETAAAAAALAALDSGA